MSIVTIVKLRKISCLLTSKFLKKPRSKSYLRSNTVGQHLQNVLLTRRVRIVIYFFKKFYIWGTLWEIH